MPGDCGVSCSTCGAVTRYVDMYKGGSIRLNHEGECSERGKMFPAVRLYQAKNPSMVIEGIADSQ